MDLQFSDRALEILKWIGLAFAAGFIGYFGRYLSMVVIEKVKKRKGIATEASSPSSAQAFTDNSTIVKDSETAKVEKKRAKSEIKKAKKESRL